MPNVYEAIEIIIMTLPTALLEPDHPDRNFGLVYREDALTARPATHVLVIGVAAYQSKKLSTVLATATISARAVADWFLDDTEAGFSNPGCELGSVALLLSETPGAKNSIYGGGNVPRATHREVENAVRAWGQRVNSHKDNLAILYVASHGESRDNRTAFLLEDFDTDGLNAATGAVSVEQLIGGLEWVNATKQLLLFDCCRSATEMNLPWDDILGSRLILFKKLPGDHGARRDQCAIFSASMGEYAVGLANGPTLFNMALMDALNGVASFIGSPGWPVCPGFLYDQIVRIVKLHRLPEEDSVQTPAGRSNGSFDITFPGESADIPVYISLDDPAEWPDCTIALTVNGVAAPPIRGESGKSPFTVRRLPKWGTVHAQAARAQTYLGRAAAEVCAPAVFLEIKRTSIDLGTTEVGWLAPDARGLGPRAQLVIRVDSSAQMEKGAVATVTRRDEPAKNSKLVTIDLGGEARVDLRPGEHIVTLRTPDGRVQNRNIALVRDQILQIVFTTASSPHEWLGTAAATGAIKMAATKPFAYDRSSNQPSPTDAIAIAHASGSRLSLSSMSITVFAYIVSSIGITHLLFPKEIHEAFIWGIYTFLLILCIAILRFIVYLINRVSEIAVGSNIQNGLDINYSQMTPRSSDLSVSLVGSLRMDLDERQRHTPLALVFGLDDGRFARIEPKDETALRFELAQQMAPVFARVTLGRRTELAVIPSLGSAGKQTTGGWTPYLLVDRLTGSRRPLTTVIVEDRTWASLIGFLAARDFATGAELLDSGLGRSAIAALEDKIRNPLAAVAGALIAVAASTPDIEKRWDPWLHNLANWFPGIPDGAIILGRRLLMRACTPEQVQEARNWFVLGFERGVPVYSLSVDWLARGLDSLPEEVKVPAQLVDAAHRLAGRVDPTHAFTVIRVDG